MPVPIPNLDDRSFADLGAEVVARIPAHSPEYTNPQPGDPGRTLIDLFAWLTDTLLYRVNLIPERQRLAFLRLLGVGMNPAVAARALLSINFDAPDNISPQLLPALTPVKGPVPFETLSELVVLPVTAETYYKRQLTSDEQKSMAPKIAELSRLYPVTQGALPYVTTPIFAGSKAEADGFDLVQASVDQALWFALLAAKADPGILDGVTTTLGKSSSGGAQILSIGISPQVGMIEWDDAVGENPPIPYIWELSTANPSDPNGVSYIPLTVVDDTTGGLRTNGIIRLSLPGKQSFFAPSNDVRTDVDAGTGPKPPRLDDPTRSARLIAWLRLRPTSNIESLPLSWAGINAVEIDQRLTARGTVVGQSNGQPDQNISLPNGNIEPSTFQLQIEEAGRGFLAWTLIDDLAVAGPQDSVYELDPEAGTLVFGDGVRGRVPPLGARVRVALMRIGGGLAGNVPAGTLTQPQPTLPPVAKLKAWQPQDATGGDDAETLAEAEKRIPALFRHRDRAVTADDYKQIALTTPGALVGRAEVLPGFKPLERRSSVPGVVSVMVLPTRDTPEAPYPRVDRPFIETIYTNLSARIPLGTELYVIGCEYIPVAIAVGIDNPSGNESVNTAVKLALQNFLFSLAPGGMQGAGWPLGRSVRQRELEVVVSRVDGVDGVDGLNLFQPAADGSWTLVSNAGDNAEIILQAWQLPELIGVIVADGDAPTEFQPTTPTGAQDGLAIPVVPEVC